MRNRNTQFRPTKAESKADITTRIAMEIIEAETSAREKKSQRLRAARLEREAAERAQEAAQKAKAANPQKKPRKAARSQAAANG